MTFTPIVAATLAAAESQRFPNGCDWHKPPGCHCKLLVQRAACYENCDDVQRIAEVKRNRAMRRILALLFVCFMIALTMSILTSRARGAELPIPAPLPKARINPNPEPHALPPVVVAPTPAPERKLPLYCKALMKFERSCAGVRAATAVFGVRHLRWLGERCATPEEVLQAEACLKE